jgi:hypothetical protein
MISSTEFQQNVGFYLKEAQKGKKIRISKSKPEKALFVLSLQKAPAGTPSKQVNQRMAKINSLIKELKISNKTESGLDFQRRVRS